MTKQSDIDTVLTLARQGLSYRKIAEQSGLSSSFCHYIAQKNGISRGGHCHEAVAWTDEMRQTLIGMTRANINSVLISKRLGVSRHALTAERRRLGLKYNGRVIGRR